MQTRFGAFVLDTDRRVLERSGKVVHLTGKAFSLLEILVGERPRMVSKRELFDRLWPDVTVAAENLKNLVSEVRTAVDDAGAASLIRTVHRFGYAFMPQTEDLHYWLHVGSDTIPIRSRVSDVGRDKECAICIDEPDVSRRHARIVISDSGVTLEDLGSKNGTRIGRMRVTKPVELHDGDRIYLGNVTVVFRTHPEAESTMTDASDAVER